MSSEEKFKFSEDILQSLVENRIIDCVKTIPILTAERLTGAVLSLTTMSISIELFRKEGMEQNAAFELWNSRREEVNAKAKAFIEKEIIETFNLKQA